MWSIPAASRSRALERSDVDCGSSATRPPPEVFAKVVLKALMTLAPVAPFLLAAPSCRHHPG
jgi:hypothetical protein